MRGGPDAPSGRLFLFRAAAWMSEALAATRLAWVDTHVIGPLIEFRQGVVLWYGATPHPSLVVNSSCSGADVMAVCAGVLAPERDREADNHAAADTYV